jgi:hypothetical protein
MIVNYDHKTFIAQATVFSRDIKSFDKEGPRPESKTAKRVDVWDDLIN